jgi:hypothetical protein
MEIASLSALALGFIGVGSCNYEVTSTILQTLMEREDSQLSDKWARFMALGLALIFLGNFHCVLWLFDPYFSQKVDRMLQMRLSKP